MTPNDLMHTAPTRKPLASWQVYALREQRAEAIANIAALAKGDIVIRDKRIGWEYTMWRRSDLPRLNVWLDSLNEQLEGYENG